MKTALDSNERDLKSMNNELVSSRNQKVALMSTNQELERHQGSIRSKLDTTQKALISFRNDYAGLMTSFNNLKRAHDTATGTMSDLSAEVAECRKTASDAMKKIEASSRDPTAITENARVRCTLDELRETLAESHRTNDLLRDKLHLHLGQIVDLNDRIKELENEKRDLLNLLIVQDEQQAKREKLGVQMEVLVDRLVKREQEVEAATVEAATLKAELRVTETR
ncbi:hypothetical protein AX15_002196 [Amanita polypyramis BW_CC]|nr:hypothetical protein AX15_002196 [Amanita polypyramis BW_CC]